MAKKLEPTKTKDFLKIKNCKECKGKPKISESIVQPFKVTKCDDCYEIVEYEKLKPIRS